MRSKQIFFLIPTALILFWLAWWWKSQANTSSKSSLIDSVPSLEEVLPSPSPADSEEILYKVEPFVSELQVPWSFVFTSDSRVIVTERPGRIRVIEAGKLLPEPLRVFQEVSSKIEEGLMGMTLDPDYESNRFLYLCMAYETEAGELYDKVVRVKDMGNSLEEDKIIIDEIPAAAFHAGCRVDFGPDRKLYISTGDSTDTDLPQKLDSLAGKILRINSDGTFPADNPFPNSAVFSYGHRNPQGFDWHPVSGSLIATEHGPSGNDGPGGGDEVNLIEAGHNYGWPEVSHQETKTGMVDPLVVFTPAVAPASGMFYSGDVFPQLKNTFLFGMLRGEGIMQVVFDEMDQVVTYKKLSEVEVGRVRDIVEGPDGYIYFTTSNRDGRGKPRSSDDQIYRLVPKEGN